MVAVGTVQVGPTVTTALGLAGAEGGALNTEPASEIQPHAFFTVTTWVPAATPQRSPHLVGTPIQGIQQVRARRGRAHHNGGRGHRTGGPHVTSAVGLAGAAGGALTILSRPPRYNPPHFSPSPYGRPPPPRKGRRTLVGTPIQGILQVRARRGRAHHNGGGGHRKVGPTVTTESAWPGPQAAHSDTEPASEIQPPPFLTVTIWAPAATPQRSPTSGRNPHPGRTAGPCPQRSCSPQWWRWAPYRWAPRHLRGRLGRGRRRRTHQEPASEIQPRYSPYHMGARRHPAKVAALW